MKNNIVKVVVQVIAFIFIFNIHVYADSLWTGATIKQSSFFVDPPAKVLKENDIVVILIDEKTTASADADTNAEVNDTVEGSISNWFSLENAGQLLNLLKFKTSNDVSSDKSATTNLPKWGFEVKNSFEGEGTTSRNNSVVASIAARVIEVRPNGNLVLEGKRNIQVNAENSILTITGIVANDDVSEDNTISSKLIAELKVTIDGRGIAANVQRRGLLSHLLNLLR